MTMEPNPFLLILLATKTVPNNTVELFFVVYLVFYSMIEVCTENLIIHYQSSFFAKNAEITDAPLNFVQAFCIS